jgi:hypothetical protein
MLDSRSKVFLTAVSAIHGKIIFGMVNTQKISDAGNDDFGPVFPGTGPTQLEQVLRIPIVSNKPVFVS